MGSLLTFKELEATELDGEPLKRKKILKKLKKNKLFDIIDCQGVKTAIRLEMACKEWDLYDKKYGVFGQYINLLTREGCHVSMELDHNKGIGKKYESNPQCYADQVLETIRETLNYQGEVKPVSKSGLYQTIKKIKAGQRVINCAVNNCKGDHVAVNTTEVLKRVLNRFGVTFKPRKKVKITNKDCINIYDSLISKMYSSNDDIEGEVYKLIKKGVRVSDRSKLRRTTALLKLFFQVKKERKAQEMTVRLNVDLVESVKDMNERHKRWLYS